MKSIVKIILTVFALFAVLILLPAILAPILHLPKLDSYFDYGGSESDWITFWGNYLGSVITGLISFVILWFTIKRNKEENKAIIDANQLENTRIIEANQEENSRIIENNKEENTRLLEANSALEESKRKQDFYLRFRSEVSVRLSKLDLSKFVGIFFDEKTQTEEALKHLEGFHRQVLEDFQSFFILYDGECDDFINEYRTVLDSILSKIQDFMMLFKNREAERSDLQKVADVNNQIRSEISNLNKLVDKIENLWKSAKVEIDKLKI